VVQQFVTFRVDGRLLGLAIDQVREINRVLDIVPVRRSADYVRGVMNLRGQVVVVLDLGARLGLGPMTIGPGSHNVLLKQEEVALLVDEIGDVVEVEPPALSPPPANLGGIAGEFIQEVAKLPDGLLAVLDVAKVLG